MNIDRQNRLLIGLGTVAAVLIIRLFVIQIVDTSYKIDASNNSMVYQTIYPTRGIIHDRNGKILVGNKIDLADDRKVSRESGKQWAERLRITETREVSAKTGEGVQDLFTDLARKLIQSTPRVEKTLPAQNANGTSCC